MFFHASFEAGLKTRLYSNIPQRKYDRQNDCSAIVRSIIIDGIEIIVSEGGRGSRWQSYYISFEMNNEINAQEFLDRTRATISTMMENKEGNIIPYDNDCTNGVM